MHHAAIPTTVSESQSGVQRQTHSVSLSLACQQSKQNPPVGAANQEAHVPDGGPTAQTQGHAARGNGGCQERTGNSESGSVVCILCGVDVLYVFSVGWICCMYSLWGGYVVCIRCGVDMLYIFSWVWACAVLLTVLNIS